jgi:nucleoside-diphosphate-sugar epimerase
MHILILGSSGQIGGPLTTFLRSQSIKVSEFDILIDPKQDLRISRNSSLINIIETEPIDFVIFLAFDVGGATYLSANQHNPDFISNNLRIMESTFQIFREYNLKFIFASSQMAATNETTYGVLKNIGEKYTKALSGIPVRFWNVYGKESQPERFHVISDFIRMAIRTSKINMLTDGTEKRDFLHANDTAKGVLYVLQNYKQFTFENEVHIASYQWRSIYEVAEIISQLTGCEIIKGEKLDHSRGEFHYSPNPKFREIVQHPISLEEGISQLVDEIGMDER